MLNLIILIALLNNLNFIVTDDVTSSDVNTTVEAVSTAEEDGSDSKIRVKCGPNQIFDSCPSSCPPRTCNTTDIAFRCIEPLKPGNPKCPRPRCRCADGYYSNDEGQCVLKEQCPKCKKNEVYSTCPNNECREKTCDEVGFPLPCYDLNRNNTACGKPACVCQDGYVRNKAGECIPTRDCPSCGGDPNAWQGCGVFCNRCTKNTRCPKICLVNSCDCRPGYVYDETIKKCVLPEQCPPQCGPNEIPSECANNPCIPTCALPILHLYCDPHIAYCKPGCVCAEGYFRDKNGICIPKEKCPLPECKENEEYTNCTNQFCQAKSCDDLGFPLTCLQDRTSIKCGDPGCDCKAGFVRNEKGICISPTDCPSCGGDRNATIGCGSHCTTCSNYYNKPEFCALSCQLNGCDCRDGYVYDEITKKCILSVDCPPQCGRNEVPSDCANNGCLPTCKHPDLQTYCDPNLANCKPGCVCAEGYLRDEKGICVRKDTCPSPQCKENEEYTNCTNQVCRAQSCDQLGFPLPCLQIDRASIRCGEPGCVCKSGFVRNKDGVCVSPTDCPSCGGDRNATSGCGTRCTTCSNYKNKPRVCLLSCQLNGCDCRDGYVYDQITKKCILPVDCPPQCGRNEVPSDCANNPCLSTCEKPDLNTYCKPNPANCKPGCVCADGYVRDKNGICVPKDKCPSTQCKVNEEYTNCTNQVCRIQSCDELGYASPCFGIDRATIKCGEPGCVCKEGFVRNKDGVCISTTDCPSCGGDRNATAGCGSYCTTCSNYKENPIICLLSCRLNGCDCRDGYVYDQITKKCILPVDCPPQCGRNEVPSDCANNPCLPTCKKPDLNTYCGPNPAGCKPGCICADGYVRDENGNCVPKIKCPYPQCKENEEYSDCTTQSCEAKTCDELGFPLPCLRIDTSKTSKKCVDSGCVCKAGLVRNKDGVCISPSDCPSCGGDNNATTGCSSYCTTCSNYKNELQICDLTCQLNGCDCRKGYVYDAITKKCILPVDCGSSQCGRNEVPSECANNPCLPTCNQPDIGLYCKPGLSGCKPGCVCANGYLRDENGVCVPQEKCISQNCPGEHEYYACSNLCDNECDKLSYQSHENCPYDNIQCTSMCYCSEGYARDANKKCIPISQCPKTNA